MAQPAGLGHQGERVRHRPDPGARVLFAVTSRRWWNRRSLLLHRRDVGLALFPARLGPASNPRLTSPDALAVRLHRGSLAGWVGRVRRVRCDHRRDRRQCRRSDQQQPQLAQIINRLGGAGVLIDAFLAALGAYAGLLAAAYAISAVLRMHTEEAAERVSPILATAVGRTRWLSSVT